MKKLIVAILMCPLSAFAAHPLTTDDTGTQDAGNWQLEVNGEVTSKQQDTGRQDLWNSTITNGVTLSAKHLALKKCPLTLK
ncbi:hypothetical protein [Pandoraea anhela]|nr:hypothetical protein [Pandoraea anhela]